MKGIIKIFAFLFILIVLESCEDDIDQGRSLTHIAYAPTSFEPDYPETFPKLEIPVNNPLTMEKIVLGQHLFFDPILSADSTMSCASCHDPSLAFTDALEFSAGIDGLFGTRSSMSLVNTGFFYNGLFWDGQVTSLEAQALLPVEDPIELHNNWPNLMAKLKDHDFYPEMFREAFGITSTSQMTKGMAARAIASYERVLISGNSKFDRWLMDLDALTDEELEGMEMYFDRNPDLPDAECAHCHESPLMSTNDYFNNGITEVNDLSNFPDVGYAATTGNPLDSGKFRAPSLRNITLTAPYMHDGRFKTIKEVLEHYNSGGHPSPNKDPLVLPLGLNEQQIENLESFLHTLVDTSYLEKAYVTNPFN